MRLRLRRFLRIVAALLSGLCFSLGVQAAGFPIHDENPSASVPSVEAQNGSPLEFGYWLMEVTDRAVKAHEANDLPRAARYYEAIARAAPHRALAFSKLCQIYLSQRVLERARPHCEKAIATEGSTTRDFERYLALELSGQKEFSAEAAGQLKEVIAHVRAANAESELLFDLECKAAIRTEDAALLEHCTEGLSRLSAGSSGHIPFEFALAYLRQDEIGAQEALARAEAATDLDPNEVKQMRDLLQSRFSPKRRSHLVLAGTILVLFGAAIASIILFRRLRGGELLGRSPSKRRADGPPSEGGKESEIREAKAHLIT